MTGIDDSKIRSLRTLVLFLATNYCLGLAIAAVLGVSLAATIAIAMLAPCLCVIAFGLCGRWLLPEEPASPIEHAR